MEETDLIKIFVRISVRECFSACITNESIETFPLGLSVYLHAIATKMGLTRDSPTNWDCKTSVARINVSVANTHDCGHMKLMTNSEFIDGLASFLDAWAIKHCVNEISWFKSFWFKIYRRLVCSSYLSA